MSQQILVVRRVDDRSAPLAHEANLTAAAAAAAAAAIRHPGVLLEVFEPESGTVHLRVRADEAGRVLVQRPTTGAGDAWPDPPAWTPLVTAS